jgi:predicted O-methyltransferase YrrM
MPYDTNIPGFCPKEQMEFMAEIAKRIPKHGKIVEVGCLFGRSAYCWAASCHETATVYCIDPWLGQKMTGYSGDSRQRGEAIQLNNTKDQFLNSMQARGIKNIVAIKEKSPLSGEWPHGSVDLAYIDGAHHYQAVYDDIKYWLRYLKKGGIMCGDDFIADFPEVVRAVADIAREMNFQIRRYQKMWMYITADNYQPLRESFLSVTQQTSEKWQP